MNIKSLLIGSAAALTVVSGAQAADAVVAAEPEPMEYVRVCDAYGTGFFYLPGTETCIKIGGRVRLDKTFAKGDGFRNQYGWRTRGEITVDAKNDSEWGTVYSWVMIRGQDGNNDGTSMQAYYYAGIGGFEYGKFDTPLVRFHGYTTSTINDGHYADNWDQQYVSYTATFDSISAIVFAINDLDSVDLTDRFGFYNGDTSGNGDGGDKFMPDVGAAVKGTWGAWEVGAGVGYDESTESFHARKWIRGDLGMFNVFAMGMYSDFDVKKGESNSFWNYDGFGVLVGASAKVTDTVSINKMVQWYDDDSWQAALGVAWQAAPGFKVTVEGSYADGGGTIRSPFGNNIKAGIIRFDRTF
jgi:hypothetical protein